MTLDLNNQNFGNMFPLEPGDGYVNPVKVMQDANMLTRPNVTGQVGSRNVSAMDRGSGGDGNGQTNNVNNEVNLGVENNQESLDEMSDTGQNGEINNLVNGLRSNVIVPVSFLQSGNVNWFQGRK
jgi:hypothetical protein